jgi:hypothetical protein
MVRGHEIHISTEIDIYFLTRIPFRGVELAAQPKIHAGVSVGALANHCYSRKTMMSSGLVSIVIIDSLEMHVFCVMVVHIDGSIGTQSISGA